MAVAVNPPPERVRVSSSFSARLRFALTEALIVDSPAPTVASASANGAAALCIGLPVLQLIEIVALYVNDGLEMTQFRAAMNAPDSIRNVTIMGAINHGKSTLVDCLVCAAETLKGSGEPKRVAAASTVKSIATSLYFCRDESGSPAATAAADDDTLAAPPILVNVIDTPGEIQLSGDLSCALRVSDGAVVVLDCALELRADCAVQLPLQVETALRLAMGERVKPVLFFNKLDSLLAAGTSDVDLERAYKSLVAAVKACNALTSAYRNQIPGMTELSVDAGSVGFGSSLGSWGFTLDRFAALYCTKFGVKRETMRSRLWGDAYFHPETKTWRDTPYTGDGKTVYERGFVQFVLRPIATVIDTVLTGTSDAVAAITQKLGIVIPKTAAGLSGKALLRVVMQSWLPASDAVLELVVNHLPSPKTAQTYRAEVLYAGLMNDRFAAAIRNCDAKGPLLMYVSRLIPAAESKGRFWSFGRVFSGTLQSAQTIRVHGPEYESGRAGDSWVKEVSSGTGSGSGSGSGGTVALAIANGRHFDAVPECGAGNFVAISGVDAHVTRGATVTTDPKAGNFVPVPAAPTPLRMAVDAKRARDFPALSDGLRRLSQSDPSVVTCVAPTGEQFIACTGERHMELCVDELRASLPGVELKFGTAATSLRESISRASSDTDGTVTAKSPTKYSSICFSAEPMSDALCAAIDSHRISHRRHASARMLADEYDWEISDARRIWTFGLPPDADANCLVDHTRGFQSLDTVLDTILSSFQQTTADGVLCGEPMRGIRFNLRHAGFSFDCGRTNYVYREVMPALQRACYGCVLSCAPVLLQPTFRCEFAVAAEQVAPLVAELKRQNVEIDAARTSAPAAATAPATTATATALPAYVPACISALVHGATAVADLSALLRRHGGDAAPTSQTVFSHWTRVGSGGGASESDPLTPGTIANRVLLAVRERKGLKLEVPVFADYYDRVV